MYLDDNGIAKVEDTDEIAPIASLLNGLQDATSEAFGSNVRVWKVANTTERAALATELGPITASNPLYVYRADSTDSTRVEYTFNGTTWFQWGTAPQRLFRITRSGGKTVPDSETTIIDTGWAENQNIGGFSFSGADITVPEAGVYLINAYIEFTSNSSGTRRMTLAGTSTNWSSPVNGSQTRLTASRIIFTSGTLSNVMSVYQSSGTTLFAANGMIEVAKIA